MNQDLLMPISEEEIVIVVRQMGVLKAPRPDGCQGIFYHSFWNSIVKEVTEMVLFLSKDDMSPRQLNATHIVLIPKVPNPESVSQFRPISLCNFSYKVFSKVLSNRLKPLLPKIISPMQNAFVGGRQIQDNIGIAHELFHFLKLRKTKSKFELGIKLDMHKAYDWVEWDFLDAVMERMRIIMGCVRSVNFAVLLNGQPGNKFVPSRGLRHGDPLSPYLFLMVNDILSRMLGLASETNKLQGVRISPHGPSISHIFFADDTLIFLKADNSNCHVLGRIIKDYCAASGQAVNLQKSCVFFSANTPAVVSEKLGNILGVPIVTNPGTYLGVPAIWGRSKSCGLAYVKGRMMGKIQSWKQCTLSFASKRGHDKSCGLSHPCLPTYLNSRMQFIMNWIL